MMLEIIGRALGMVLIALCLMACVLGFSFYLLHLSEEADFKYEIRMGKDINRIGRDLKAAGLDDATVQIFKNALEDVRRNTESYVDSKSSVQPLPFIVFGPMVVAFWIHGTFHRKAGEQKRPALAL